MNPSRVLAVAATLLLASPVFAADYFLTIGGGYAREGNQASLEANVRFLQEILIEEYPSPPSHMIYFADGEDDGKDLQVAVKRPSVTAKQLVSRLHRSRTRSSNPVTYRDHQVAGIAGSTSPQNIRDGVKELALRVGAGDRLFVYVTAHGSSAKGKNKHNTTINCWGRKAISAEQFTQMLDGLPEDVPVVMVMAQCYCGGFAHVIFDDANADERLSKHLRTGFFAQQHNLPAAGCRPDIENDEEYSSFFWGALVGRSRNGKTKSDIDLDGDHIVSLAEAHAHAVLASNTIDIPLRASESLLRHYSRMRRADDPPKYQRDEIPDVQSSDRMIELLEHVPGTLEEFASTARPDVQALIMGLTDRLGISLESSLGEVVAAYQAQRNTFHSARRDYRRSWRRRSGTSKLRDEVFEAFPDLADKENWHKSELFSEDQRDGLLEDIKAMDSFAAYEQSLQKRRDLAQASEDSELDYIKHRRLVETLVSVSLANNLSLFASDRIVDRYVDMVSMEETGLGR